MAPAGGWPPAGKHVSLRYLAMLFNGGAQSSSEPIPLILAPASTYRISPMIPEARSDDRNAAALPTSVVVTLRRSGARLAFSFSIRRKLAIPEAARVLIGPAEIAFTRMPSSPRLAAI